ncbi:hypothetical protein CPR19088_GLDEOEPO_00267 [Companilactobacillus paralimentarius]
MQENLVAVGTGSSQGAVSTPDFELRKEREFQNSSRGVSTKVLTPPALLPNFLHPETRLINYFGYEIAN